MLQPQVFLFLLFLSGCLLIKEANGACTTNDDCPIPELCLFNNLCGLEPCESDAQCPSLPYANRCLTGFCENVTSNACSVCSCCSTGENTTCFNESVGCVVVVAPTPAPTAACLSNEDCLAVDPDHVLFCNAEGLCATIPCSNDTQCEERPYEGNFCVIGGCDEEENVCFYVFCEEFDQVCENNVCIEVTAGSSDNTTTTTLVIVMFVFFGFIALLGLCLWCIALASRRRQKSSSSKR